ncbi:hypothetical protein AMECASPLE_026638 [Ameca splendens]|uniref:Uncharacterized protein n=1 Tax=Ameca splendens TaxID=208324 RepID=A0ABV0Y4X0_9TELE
MVLSGVCPVAPVGGGWVGVAVALRRALGLPSRGWLHFGLLPLLDQFRPPSNVGPISTPPHSLPVAGVSASAGVFVVLGVWGWMLWCVPAQSRRLLGQALVPGLCRASAWGVICLRVSVSLGPWLDLLWRRWLPVGPVGSLLQLPGAPALCLLGGFPGTLPCSSLEEVAVVPGDGSPGFPVLWGAFGCLWLGSPLYQSQVQGGRSVAPHTLLHIFKEKLCIRKHAHTQTHRYLDLGVNAYTNVLY